MAALGRRPRQHEILGARSNQPRQRQEPARGMAVEGGQLRAAAAEQPRSHAADGRRRALHDRGHAPVGRGHRRRDRRDALDVSTRRRRARRHGAAQRVARRRVLDRRQAAAHHPHHARLSHGVARRENRTARSVVRAQRRHRSLRRLRSADAEGRHDQLDVACRRRQQRDRGRRRAAGRHRAAVEGKHEGLRARIRRPERQAHLDLPHDSASGRIRQRHMAERFVGLHGQHRRVVAVFRGRRARLRVSACRVADRRFLRRPSSGQQPVRGQPRVPRGEDRQACVAPAARPPRHLGLRHRLAAEPDQHHRQRQADPRRRAGHQAELRLRVRSRDGRSRVADRGAEGSRRATRRANGIRRRSRIRPSRRRSIIRACRKRI